MFNLLSTTVKISSFYLYVNIIASEYLSLMAGPGAIVLVDLTAGIIAPEANTRDESCYNVGTGPMEPICNCHLKG